MKDNKETHVVLGFGRCNPPSIAHELLIKRIQEHATKVGGDAHFYLSKSQGNHKNPLPYDYKHQIAEHAFGDIVKETSETTPYNLIKTLSGKYDHLTLVTGDDRVPQYTKLLNNGKGKDFNFKTASVIGIDRHDPESSVGGMSATAMREHAKNGNHQAFSGSLPTKLRERSHEIMSKVRKGMNLKENLDEVLQEEKHEYLYHATYEPHLKSIYKHGLNGLSTVKNHEDSKHNVVYLAKNPHVAVSHAEASDTVPEHYLDKIKVLKINKHGLQKNLLHKDSNVIGKSDTLEYHGIIHPKHISLHENLDEDTVQSHYKNFAIKYKGKVIPAEKSDEDHYGIVKRRIPHLLHSGTHSVSEIGIPNEIVHGYVNHKNEFHDHVKAAENLKKNKVKEHISTSHFREAKEMDIKETFLSLLDKDVEKREEVDPVDLQALEKKALAAAIPVALLREVYLRGMKDWDVSKTTLTAKQYAFNRVNSYLNEGRAFWQDKDLTEAWAHGGPKNSNKLHGLAKHYGYEKVRTKYDEGSSVHYYKHPNGVHFIQIHGGPHKDQHKGFQHRSLGVDKPVKGLTHEKLEHHLQVIHGNKGPLKEDIQEDNGGGFIGTSKLTKNYASMTPGQQFLKVIENKYSEDKYVKTIDELNYDGGPTSSQLTDGTKDVDPETPKATPKSVMKTKKGKPSVVMNPPDVKTRGDSF